MTEWIADGMHDLAKLMLGRINLPYFLEADAVMLRVSILAEIEFVYQLLAQVASATFSKQCVLGV